MPELTSTEEQALKLIAEAKEDKTTHEPWQRDIYKYAMPWRRRSGEAKQVNDQDELFDPTAIAATNDFAADMQSALTPDDDPWLVLEPSKTLSAADAAMVSGQIEAYQDTVFSEIRRSNFHEATQEAYPDLATGTFGMNIQDLGVLTDPIHCQAVPITDLLLVRGVYGGVDFRCREIPAMKLRDVQPTYPRAYLPREIDERANKDPGGTVNVKECWWRLWDKRHTERWQYCLLVDEREADCAVFKGPGSCSLITPRWRTDSTTAWGIGPLYVVLPTIKTADQLAYLALKALSFAVDPAFFYDNDGQMNFENGLGPGDAIPRVPGSKIDWFKSEADFDTTFFSQDRMQQAIKRALYQDGPQQTGDTPPTATQWMSEDADVAKRMGAPFGRLKSEWQIPVFQRFVYLLERRGIIPKGLKLNGGKVSVRSESPLAIAQRQKKVIAATQLLTSAAGWMGPQQLALTVKGRDTFAEMKKALGDNMIHVNTEEEMQALMQQAMAATSPPPPPQ